MPNPRSILVLEDDPNVAATISGALTRDGWEIETASTLAAARACLNEENPRIAVVDLGLPDGNGITFVREAAARGDLGVIVVSGQSDEVDRVVGLEVGADDYLAKPFSLREMVARVRALSRRLDGVKSSQAAVPGTVLAEPPRWNLGGVIAEPSRRRLVPEGGEEVRLTGGEAGLLSLLLEMPDNVADRETISEKVLGRRLLPEQRGVDQLASNLRHKLGSASDGRVTIAAVRGRGYRLMW